MWLIPHHLVSAEGPQSVSLTLCVWSHRRNLFDTTQSAKSVALEVLLWNIQSSILQYIVFIMLCGGFQYSENKHSFTVYILTVAVEKMLTLIYIVVLY